jgi:adenosylcobyric acid synthase
MLGRTIADPDGIEGPAGSVEGLGFLDVETVLTNDKVTAPASGHHVATGAPVTAYEIHLGRTSGPDCSRPVLLLEPDRPDGAVTRDGLVQGCYVHGLFAGDEFRRAFLAGFGAGSALAYEAEIEAALDSIAAEIEAHLDLDQLLKIARCRSTHQ